MNSQQRKTLLKTARDSAEAAVNQTQIPKPKSDDPQLNENCGCFVTLKNGERLRGCIGQFISDKPLIELIGQMAIASATGDPRFFNDPITTDELNCLNIEISVLSPLQKTDDPLSLELGKDGIYIKQGPMSGCFLPQVATEMNWTKEEFLSYCCSHKAGLPPEAWKDENTDVFLFTAEVFDEDYDKI